MNGRNGSVKKPLLLLAGLVLLAKGAFALWYFSPSLSTEGILAAFAPPVEAQQTPAATDPAQGSAPAPSAAADPTKPTAPDEADRPSQPVDVGSLDLEILQDVEKRQKALDAREKELDRKEERLNALSGDLDSQITELKALQAKIEEQIKMRTDLEDEAVTKLAKTYGSMSPTNAAQLIGKLDRRIAVRVLSAIKERNAARILAAMPPDLASDLSERMVKRPTGP
ncbi:MAG: hypothetical protein HQK87_00985 [Nitrospinae bacterium]|nr:hypothetical protein [Nitrospinota bacterium]